MHRDIGPALDYLSLDLGHEQALPADLIEGPLVAVAGRRHRAHLDLDPRMRGANEVGHDL